MGNFRVLVVDDEIDILKAVVLRLQKAGYEVLTAADGKAALQCVKDTKPDLLLIDFCLPLMTGGEVCLMIKSDETLKHIPVIIMSAGADNIQAKISLYFIDDYVVKPFEHAVLLEKIKVLLEEKVKGLSYE